MSDTGDLTVPLLLDRRARDAPDGVIAFPDARMSYPQLAGATLRFAAALLAHGVRAGDSVGVLLHGCMDSLVAWLAAARVGAVTVPINVRFKSAELAYVIENADLSVLVTSTDFAAVLGDALPSLSAQPPAALRMAEAPRLSTVVLLDSAAPPPGYLSRADFEAAGASVPTGTVASTQDQVRPDDVIVMMYTSGTTSRPRGCLHSHASLVHLGLGIGERLRLDGADRFWTPLPMFHVGGVDVAMASIAAGCSMVHVGTFEPGRAVAQLAAERCTVAFPAFETIWLPVLDHPSYAAADLSALRLVINVGTPERMRAMQARHPHAVQISCTGMTESCGFCCVGSPDDSLEERSTTCGRPLPGMQVRVIDPQTGAAVPDGTPGEFLFRGVSRFIGYHRDPELTAERIDADGWCHSGDQVVRDREGRVTFLTRLGDILKVGGENVAAAEIEGFLSEHPAVGIVQVVGAPDARYGEVAAAFVQPRPGATVTEEEIIEYCRGRIATFKIPRYVRVVEDWPMSGTKVQKFTLRERIARELDERGITEAPRISSRTSA